MKRKVNRPLSEFSIMELWRQVDLGLISERDAEREIARRMNVDAIAQRRE